MNVAVVVSAFPRPEHRAEVIAAFEAALDRIHDQRAPSAGGSGASPSDLTNATAQPQRRQEQSGGNVRASTMDGDHAK
jgi:hypothetical protein